MWIRICELFLLFVCYTPYVLTKLIYEDPQLYEGSRCQLKNGGGEGICVKAIDCPIRIQQINDRNYSASDRCGYQNFTEIVCCSTNQSAIPKNRVRPAKVACQKYSRVITPLPTQEPTTMEPTTEESTTEQPPFYSGALGIYSLAPGDVWYTFSVYTAAGGVSVTQDERKDEFPYLAALGYPASKAEAAGGIKYICGGTLISEKHVLTAAHCVSNIQGFVPVEVLLGTTDLTVPEVNSTKRVRISRIIKHPWYKVSLNYHDVAILVLEDPVQLTASVYPVCMTTEPLTSENSNDSFTVLGWGVTGFDEPSSDILQKVERLSFLEKEECSHSYVHLRGNIPNGLDDGMICIRDPDTNRSASTCPGDSGGPLLQLSRLVGVTSFGQLCGANAPSVYTSVYKYLDWIEDQVWSV